MGLQPAAGAVHGPVTVLHLFRRRSRTTTTPSRMHARTKPVVFPPVRDMRRFPRPHMLRKQHSPFPPKPDQPNGPTHHGQTAATREFAWPSRANSSFLRRRRRRGHQRPRLVASLLLWQALLLAVSDSERSDLREVPDQGTIRSVRRSGGAWLALARNCGIAAKAVVAPHPFLRSSEPLFGREGDERAGREEAALSAHANQALLGSGRDDSQDV